MSQRILPILFSTPMVQAIMDGRKSMTRRIISADVVNAFDICPVDGPIAVIDGNGDCHEPTAASRIQVGDTLWVRETWISEMNSPGGHYHGRPYYYYRADFESEWLDPCETISGGYPSECRYYPGCEGCTRTKHKPSWHPSIFMPKEACRLFLRVTDVRAERLWKVTNEDALKEGFEGVPCTHAAGSYACVDCMNTGWLEPPAVGFMMLWDSLNSKRGYGWDTNPWVWVYGFERIEKPEGWPL